MAEARTWLPAGDPGLRPVRRVLVTGVGRHWGARLAQAVEGREEVEAVIAVDSSEPVRELRRAEFVRVSSEYPLIKRIVRAAEIDTVIDTRLIVDSLAASRHKIRDTNVIGTLNILAACSGADSPVRRYVLKSSAHVYGCAQDDPAFFRETDARRHPPRTAIERSVVEAEAAVADFAESSPGLAVTVLRAANVLGPEIDTSHVRLLSLPAVPMILGFDPRYQFVHEDDVIRAHEHVTFAGLSGVYNLAPDGVLALSEVIGLLDKLPAPILPPWCTAAAAAGLRPFGVRIPEELLGQLRFGRGVDNRRLKATGFSYTHSSSDTVRKFGERLKLEPVTRGLAEPYRFEQEVESFLRRSPNVRRRSEV